MAIVRKFTIGVKPFNKMFRMFGQAGATTDAVLALRLKSLPEDYFAEVGVNPSRTAYRVSSQDQSNALQLTEESVAFTKDYYDLEKGFDFSKVLTEFRTVWGAVNSVLNIKDIRTIGMVAEYRFTGDEKSPSGWLRDKLTILKTKRYTEKFHLRFEEREFASDGKAPDPKKSDFINYIYNFYDGAIDAQHPSPKHIHAELDVQRYFTPVFNGSVGDEVLKLHTYFEAAQKRLNDEFKEMGASHGKK